MALSLAEFRSMGETDLTKTLRAFRRSLDQTQEQLARKLGLKRTTYTAYEQGIAAPPHEILEKLKELGMGRPAKSAPEGRVVSLAGTPMAQIPVVGSVSAGPGATNVDPDAGCIWVPERLAQLGGIGWLVDGESMMPLLEPGDVALFREHRNPRRGYVFLSKSPDDEFRVKKIDWLDGEWAMVSLNRAHGTAPLGSNQLLGYLIGWYRYRGTRETLDSDPGGLRFD